MKVINLQLTSVEAAFLQKMLRYNNRIECQRSVRDEQLIQEITQLSLKLSEATKT